MSELTVQNVKYTKVEEKPPLFRFNQLNQKLIRIRKRMIMPEKKNINLDKNMCEEGGRTTR
jgi:hypothetical protein